MKFEIYTGKKGNKVEKQLGARVVLNTTAGLENKYYKVYFDNHFTSVDLIQKLKDIGILACGTVKKT